MATFERFEDIHVWRKSRELTRLIYRLTRREPLNKDWELQRALRKTAISMMANIAEGFGRKSHREFANFLNIAHGSAAELQSHLYVASDQNYLNQKDFSECYSLCDECSRMLQSLQDYLRRLPNSSTPKLLNP